MPQLFVLSGSEVGKSFVIAHGSLAGRTPECAVVLKHASISRRHARFELQDGRWHVIDEGSRNGVIVERRRVQSLELADQSEFQLGEILLRFRIAEPALASVPAEARAGPAQPAVEPDEISLEDSEDEPPPIQAARGFASPPEHARAAARIQVDPGLMNTSVSPRVPPRPALPTPAPSPRSTVDTGFGPASAAGGSISRSTNRAGERVLQYHKVENTRGAGGTDLTQLSGGVKLLIALGAVALMALLAWFAFSGTSMLKERIVERDGGASEEVPPSPEDSTDGD